MNNVTPPPASSHSPSSRSSHETHPIMHAVAQHTATARVVAPTNARASLRKSSAKIARPMAAPLRRSIVAAAADAEEPGSAAKGMGKSLPAAMDIDAIMDLLPHRYPFLLVDRVVEIETGSYAIGVKNVTINDNFFPGHFPQRPIMPGVLMVEAMAQVGGLVMLEPGEKGQGGTQKEFFFAGIDGVKFRRPVVPGDTLVMKVVLTKLNKRFGIAKMKGQCFVGEELACEAELTLALGA